MTEKTVKVLDQESGKEVILPVYEPVLGKPVIDIAALPKELGYFTHDPGYGVTSSCESAITFINGEKGELLYRGYPIEQLAEKKDFLDVAYLLYFGELPNEEQSKKYREDIEYYEVFNERLRYFYANFNYDAHPMAMIMSVVSSLAGFYHQELDITDPEQRYITAVRLLAKMPCIAGAAYRHNKGLPFLYPKAGLGFAENFLRVMFDYPNREYVIDPVAAKAMDLLFILHADHEQNASTSTVRLAGSTGTNPYAAVACGIAALWGPAHGGANEAVLKMLNEIGSVENVDKYIAKAKSKDDPFRLMGFGHRVYRNYDPRAKIIQGIARQILERYGNDPRMELAMKLEEIALKDEYFIERKLYPNVDFYSGIIYSALGIPENMFTAIFAIARTAGWVAHWNEMLSANYRIGRPRQLYTGHPRRDVV